MSKPFVLVLAAAALLAVGPGLALESTPAPAKRADFRAEAAGATVVDGSPALDAGDAAHGFGPVVLMSASDFGGEPGVDVGPNGVVYGNGPSGVGNFGSWMYKSADGGATWARCGFTTGPGGGDSNVAINPQGKIAMNDLWLGSLTFYISSDGCATWTTMPVSTTMPAGDRQWLDYGFHECQFVQSWNHLLQGLRIMTTENCGLTWRDVSTPAFPWSLGNLVVDHSGASQNVYQFYAEDDAIRVFGGPLTPSLVGSSVVGTVRIVQPAQAGVDVEQSFPAGAVDAAGHVHVVWHEMRGSGATAENRILYAKSTDLGVTWTPAVVIGATGSNVFPWIDAGAAGKVNAVWYHADTMGDPNANAGPWFVHLAQTLDGGATWTQSRATPFSIHNDNICTSGLGCGGDDRDLLDFFEVAHDAQGRAVIAFTKDTDANGGGNGNPRNAFVRQTSGPTIG